MSDVVDAEFEESSSSAIAVRTAAPVAVSWTPSFSVAVDEAIERKREKRRFFENVMDDGLHYGVIPGTGTKPTLFKAGAEMLLANMGLNPECSDAEPPIVDVTGRDHNGEPYIHYRRVCRIYRQLGPTVDERMIVGRAEGSCSSWEPKYRYRNDQRKCPKCGKSAIIAGKKEYGGGFICFKKKDGCGAKFAEDDPSIAGQLVGKVANPDVAELENTVLKMADKRALVAATLIATGCSDIFTQDVEDMRVAEEAPAPAAAPVETFTPTDLRVARARELGLIPPGDKKQGLIDLQNYAQSVEVAWGLRSLDAHFEDLVAERADAAAAQTKSAAKRPTPSQKKMYFALCGELQMDDPARHAFNAVVSDHKTSFADFTFDEAHAAIDELNRRLLEQAPQ